MRRVCLATLVLLALFGATAAAQPAAPERDEGDYDIDNNAWNGLTTFTALARGMGLSVQLRRNLDWTELEPRDILVILYPSSNVVPHHLSSFISGGGRVVLGDDFGSSHRVFAELGILRKPAVGVGATEYYDNLPFAPVATRVGDDPLAAGAPSLVTNHPAIFTELAFAHPIYRFGKGETVVASGRMGAGQLVALADPSILINRMLQFEGNFQFAVNLLRQLMSGGSRRMVVVTGEFTLRGAPPPSTADQHGSVASVVAWINEWLRRDVNAYVATEATARGLAVLLAGLVSVLLLVVLPLRARGELDGKWIRARPDAPAPLDMSGIVAIYDRPQRRQSFALAAATLRDGLVRRLSGLAQTPDPLSDIPERELYRRLEGAGFPEAAAQLRPIYGTLRGLPSRAHAASQWQSRFVSLREFERLSAVVSQVYRSLEES